MPDNNAIAIIQFETKSHASNAFKKLHDFTIHGTPLYLEWAPENLFLESDSLMKKRDFDDFNNKDPVRKNSESMNNQNSVYITNLNFTTTNEEIENLISKKGLPKVKVVKIIFKENKSMGFGFIDCHTREDAENLIKTLQGELLGNHMLKLSLSKKKGPVSNINQLNNKQNLKKIKKEEIKENNKLMIRNIAFQSNEKELRELIRNIAELKTLRCPRKVNGELRGFGFAEFGDVEDAKKVLAFLGNVHFYGRKLVVEFAKGESQF
jgi:multiple RNA-binding domain-containing protein 1